LLLILEITPRRKKQRSPSQIIRKFSASRRCW